MSYIFRTFARILYNGEYAQRATGQRKTYRTSTSWTTERFATVEWLLFSD